MSATLTAVLLLGLGLVFFCSLFFVVGRLQGPTPKQRLVPDRPTSLKLLALFVAMIGWGGLAKTLTGSHFPECETLPSNEQYWVGLLIIFPIYVLFAVAISLYKKNIEEGRVRDYVESAAQPCFRHWQKKRRRS